MNVTLVNPKPSEGSSVELHMSLLYLSTVLDKHGYDVRIIDGQIENAEKHLKHFIGESSFIGFSVMTVQAPEALRLSDLVKEIDPDIPIV